MGLNNEYNYNMWDDEYDDYIGQPEDIDNDSDVILYTQEELEDLYSTELLNMWYLVREEFPLKTYQSFCNFCFGPSTNSAERDVPLYISSLWGALQEECMVIIEDKTLYDFFVYLYK
jgi:hypothetical protein